ncbi:MAG: hypothetical protein ACI9JM_002476 [Halioglobus sp.]|jgi:hypothetical protein
MIKRFKLLLALPLLFLCASVTAVADDIQDSWKFSLTPYIWLPRIEGNLNYELPLDGGGAPNFSVGPTDWVELLNAAALLSGSARKGKFSITSDFVYLSLTSKNDGSLDSVTTPGTGGRVPVDASLNLNTRTDFDGTLWTVSGGYALQDTDRMVTDIFVGVRYFGVDVSTRWDLAASISAPVTGTVLEASGSRDKEKDMWDGIVGVRGHYALDGGKWRFPYSFDVGTGSSDLSLNAMAGVSRAFGWGDLVLVYRHLEYDQGDDDLLEDFSFTGPAMGATFHF